MATCLILPFAIAQLFNPAAALAQSTAFSSSDSQMRFERFSDRDAAIPNSLTRAQLDTESYLAAPVSSFAVRCNELIQASELFKTIDITVFFDRNVEGVFDGDTEVNMKSGVSMAKSLSHALRLAGKITW